MEQQITVGETYSVRYPFVREKVELFGEDGPYETMSWRPGAEWEQEDEYRDAVACADAFGEMLLTVVSLHKPGRFPTRAFYTRQWKDPDGRVFGKGGLRISTAEKFRRISKGYRHEVWVDGERAT
ncbi:MAG: hypothetical protein ACOY5W_08980 [Pseudomonadota bacterium]